MAEGQSRLVVFDVEGVIIPKVRFLLFEVFGKVGVKSFIKAAFYGLQYFMGLVSLKEALRKSYKLLEGVPYDRFISFFQKITLMPGVEAVFRELRDDGSRTALISSGIPRIAVDSLAGKLGSDYASGVEVGVSDGRLTGEIWGDVIEPDGKATALRKILEEHHLESSYSYAVADDRNNLPLFRLCNVKIGYNPDFALRYKSDHVVKGELAKILPIVRGESSKHQIGQFSGNMALRKAIHIGGFSTTILASYLIDRFELAQFISLVALLYLVSETLRMMGVMTPVISKITGMAAGESEFQEFVISPVSYALGVILALVAFPEPIGYVSIAVLTLGDGFASILGAISTGRSLPFSKDKTFEGCLGGFLVAFLGSLLFVDPYRAVIASFVGILVEAIPLPIDDNLMIPLASGLALTVLTMM